MMLSSDTFEQQPDGMAPCRTWNSSLQPLLGLTLTINWCSWVPKWRIATAELLDGEMSLSTSPSGAWHYCTTALPVWKGAQRWPPGNFYFPLGSITRAVACGWETCSRHCCSVWGQRWTVQQHSWEMQVDELPKKPQQELKPSVWSFSPTNPGEP